MLLQNQNAILSSLFFLLLILLTSPSLVYSQQPYEGLFTTDCYNTHNASSLLGYFCNATANSSTSCTSYLTFHPTSPYNTAAAVSSLLNVDASVVSLSGVNSSSSLLVVPVDCSCSGEYFQYNASYTVQSGDTALIIANGTYQALSTCQAIIEQNLASASSELQPGQKLTIPLRCACPTTQQYNNGVRYLLSYLVSSGETLYSISQTFGIDDDAIAAANELSVSDTINFFTTLLIPLTSKPDFTQVSVVTPPPPPPPASASPSGKSSSHVGVYAAIAVAAVVFLLIVFVLGFVVLKKRKKESTSEVVSGNNVESKLPIKKNDNTSLDILKEISGIGSLLKVYTFKELQMATNNFSLDNQIGGSVYRGTFQGDLAVVKRFDRDISREVDMLKQINHFNLIRLSGISFNEGYWYLVCEYAANGSLSDWIWGTNKDSRVLNWAQRLQVSLDVANGLNYLHSFTQPPYVHMDIRTTGILLDSNLRAKISNLTNARPVKGRELGEFTMTQHIAGLQGYLAPEYLEHGLVSPKIDVYAFGVVLLEIFTGKENGVVFDEFCEMSKGEISEVSVKGLLDPLMEANFSVDSAILLIELIVKCVQMEPSGRPSMSEVVQYLGRMSGMSTSWYSTESFSSERVLLMREE